MSQWTDKAGRRHVGVMVNGRRIHRILPQGASASDAKQLEAGLRSAIAKRIPSIPGDPLLTDVMALYIEHAGSLRSPSTAKMHAHRLGRWMEGYRVSDVRQASAAFVRDAMPHYAPATINRSLGTLKKALRLAWSRDAVHADYSAHIKRLPEHNKRTTYLTVEEVGTLAQFASENVRAAIWIALFTGCRRGEICKIAAADFGSDTIRIEAGNTKTLKRRDVPIVSALRPWLGYLPLPINAQGLKTGFHRARMKAGMRHVNFHDLRHSCATIMLASGVDLYTISKVLGHASPTTTARYAHMQIDKQREALEKAFG